MVSVLWIKPSWKMVVSGKQCDQTTKLYFQYLGISNNENLSKVIKNCQLRFQIFPIQNKPSKIAKNFLQKW